MRITNKKMRILFVTDSLGAPRPAVPWEFTYPGILQSKFCDRPEVFFCYETRRGSTTCCLSNPDLLVSYTPDIAIVQLGIVDCVPRIFTQLENVILSRLPGLIRNILIWLGTRFRRRSAKRAYVKPDACIRNWQDFLNKTGEINCRVVIIPVALPGKVFSEHNPEAEKSIRIYNESVEKLAENFSHVYILPNWDKDTKVYDDLFLPDDGYHFSKYGHEKIAEFLFPFLEEKFLKKD